MKKLFIFILCVSLLMAPISGHAAATKCVKLSPSTTCTVTPVSDKIDWKMTCGGIPISGIGVCSSERGSLGQVAVSIPTSISSSATRYCWCKMTSPAVSRFVFANIFACPSLCASRCSSACPGRADDNASFRSLMFSEMTE